MGERRTIQLRTSPRPSPFRQPINRFDPPAPRPRIVTQSLPPSLPSSWKSAFGVTLAALASFAIVALQVFAILRVLVLFVGPVTAEPISPRDIRVIDGDTIRVHHKQPDVRLVGFNAPETRRSTCEAERELGAKATRRLRDLVAAGNLDFQFVACACRPGTEGTPQCNFGRHCGVLKSSGRDVGGILIAEGLAVSFQCGGTGCPRTPRPWCH